MTRPSAPDRFPAVIENRTGAAPVIVICEHASNAFPAPFGPLGLSAEQQKAHIAWDPGALGLARGLALRLDAPLVHAQVSRLIYDCNRPPDAPGAMPATSEVHSIPGNAALTPKDRQARVDAVYLPFHDTLHGLIAARLAQGPRPTLITVHSFTPIWFGQPRAVELGIIHDADPALARAVHAAARRRGGIGAELNAPYSAADGVTHTLRLHAGPYGLANVMLEIRNDLIATPEAEETMTDFLFPILSEALAAAKQAVA